MKSPSVIWIKRLDRGPSIKLTLDGKQNYGAAWTPDGRSVTFSSKPGDRRPRFMDQAG